MDEYRRKILGMIHLSTVPLQFSRVKEFVQIHSGEQLLGDFHINKFNELTAHEILDRLGVEKYDQ